MEGASAAPMGFEGTTPTKASRSPGSGPVSSQLGLNVARLPENLARVVTGARPASLPGCVGPCLATLRETPPEAAHWPREIKYDGYRVQAHLSAGRARLYTRRGYDWTERL